MQICTLDPLSSAWDGNALPYLPTFGVPKHSSYTWMVSKLLASCLQDGQGWLMLTHDNSCSLEPFYREWAVHILISCFEYRNNTGHGIIKHTSGHATPWKTWKLRLEIWKLRESASSTFFMSSGHSSEEQFFSEKQANDKQQKVLTLFSALSLKHITETAVYHR